ncbi:MAG: hypothetical protein ACE15E_12170 [Acidobacteriota bacterium]
MKSLSWLAISIGCLILAVPLAAQHTRGELPTGYVVKYVVPDAVYLEGGTASGLATGMKLSIQRKAESGTGTEIIAELEVVSVTVSSAVCAITRRIKDPVQGDQALLSAKDVEARALEGAADEAAQYPMIVSFSDGDPIDEELREYVPKPPLPEINRIRGRIGIEYGGINGLTGPSRSSHLGLVVRADATRIGGTHWRFNGYHRGRLDSRRSRRDETLTDLLNRTYQLGFTYDNPESRWVLGVGRVQVPWASSLSVVDGGYAGRRLGRRFTLGLFGGSSPDPTSWRYAPDRQLTGAFVNLESGTFKSVRHSSTFGLAFDYHDWKPDRRFGFLENTLFYKNSVSVYHNFEMDKLKTDKQDSVVPSRSFLTVRVRPARIVSFDVSHNYFREVPTFDSRLVGTGLLDKMLFQGASAGVRLELPGRISPYASLGRSSRTGDGEPSWNTMYGFSVPWRLFRLDARRSRFDSSFAAGTYSTLTASREVGQRLRVDVQGGWQRLSTSPGTRANRAHWMTLNADWHLNRYFVGTGVTFYRGNGEEYDQWSVNGGYRF